MRIFWALLIVAVVGGLYFVAAPAGRNAPQARRADAPTAATDAAAERPPVASGPAKQPAKAAVATADRAPAPEAVEAESVSGPRGSGGGTGSAGGLDLTTLSAATGATPAEAPFQSQLPQAAAEAPATVENVPEVGASPAFETKNPSEPARESNVAATRTPKPIPGITDGATGTGTDAMAAQTLAGSALGEPVALPEHAVFKGPKSVPGKAVRKPDGSLLIDDRFVVKGSGTAADPFLVPWDMIISAQETYKPRLGLTRIPQRIAMLDGKYVKISGFIAFPITAASPKEALVMLNQWDGCCIGTPPTPYDAIEVKLATPATGGQKVMASGAISGIFKVDPYEDGGWLLGLYMMDDATLSASEVH